MGFFSGQRPDTLGVREGRLAPCPETPNCVSSQTDPKDAGHYIAALNVPEVLPGSGAHTAPGAHAWSALMRVLRATERAAVVDERPGYARAEFKSRWMGYVDDVEFLWDEKAGLIDVRSASRLGRSDFGVNRKRIEDLRKALTTQLAHVDSKPGA